MDSLAQTTTERKPVTLNLSLSEAVIAINALEEIYHLEGLSDRQSDLHDRLRVFVKAAGCEKVNGWWMIPRNTPVGVR